MKSVKRICTCIALLPGLFAYGQKTISATSDAKPAVYRKAAADNNAVPDMRGAYHMDRHVITKGTHDTMLHTTQLKLYTNNYFIYVRPHENDSLADYGIGTYMVQDGRVMEYPFYTSSGGARLDSFQLLVNRQTNGYSQIMNVADPQTGDLIVTEDYTNISRPLHTPLDGAWKEVKTSTITREGKQTQDDHPVQFKVYESGHFIWVNTVTSRGERAVSRYGFGTFAMKGRNEAIETNTSSSYHSSLVGKPVTVKIKLLGPDSYEQTIVQANGDRSIERYERLH